jgi:hypothetical protein
MRSARHSRAAEKWADSPNGRGANDHTCRLCASRDGSDIDQPAVCHRARIHYDRFHRGNDDHPSSGAGTGAFARTVDSPAGGVDV